MKFRTDVWLLRLCVCTTHPISPLRRLHKCVCVCYYVHFKHCKLSKYWLKLIDIFSEDFRELKSNENAIGSVWIDSNILIFILFTVCCCHSLSILSSHLTTVPVIYLFFKLKTITMIFLLISLYSLIISLKCHDINTCLERRDIPRKREIVQKDDCYTSWVREWLRHSEYEQNKRPFHDAVTNATYIFCHFNVSFSLTLFFSLVSLLFFSFTWVFLVFL